MSLFTNGTNCRLFKMGRIVAFWNLGRIVAWDELSPNRVTTCEWVHLTTKHPQTFHCSFQVLWTRVTSRNFFPRLTPTRSTSLPRTPLRSPPPPISPPLVLPLWSLLTTLVSLQDMYPLLPSSSSGRLPKCMNPFCQGSHNVFTTTFNTLDNNNFLFFSVFFSTQGKL